ncbi:MAG: AAA family ATPase [Xanthomonadales bacterium]|nr:AAA family ATPase [Xanthomonadales bacterium]
MSLNFTVPTPTGEKPFAIEPGNSLIFVGANGGGKTRLAVHIENQFQLNAHRISAHRALDMKPDVVKITERSAVMGLKTGSFSESAQIAHRDGERWQGQAATALLNDFDVLLQTLFAEQTNKTLVTHKRLGAGDTSAPEPTKFERLTKIWERLLPHRRLEITGDDIRVKVAGSQETYSARDMSDGERSIFYMIGQALAVDPNLLLIIDEPELHIHPSIMASLWDEIEAARPDCGFVFITHDLVFAAARSAQKFVICDYTPTAGWNFEPVPENTGFDEEIATLILGSRRPILFVEGAATSLDVAIYRSCYPDWTVIPRGSCEEVIHSVVTMRANASLTRVTCSGIVDADDYAQEEIAYLGGLGIAVLPVSEIENLFLLPSVGTTIAANEGHADAALTQKLDELKQAVFAQITPATAEAAIMRYCRRRIDRTLKKIDLSTANTVGAIAADYAAKTGALDVAVIAAAAQARIDAAVAAQDMAQLARCFDNKGLLALCARHLKGTTLAEFEGWLNRALRNNTVPALKAALGQVLPTIQAN